MDVLQPKFTRTVLAKNQTATDIVKGLRKAISESSAAAKEVAKQFRSADPEQTVHEVYDWAKGAIRYYREPKEKQTARPLARILHDGYGDCKQYTTMIFSVLRALGINANIRLISQDKDNKDPKHVYVVSNVNGREYIVDPVMSSFNKECQYYYKCDLTPKNMSLEYLNGIDDLGSFGRAKHHRKISVKQFSNSEKNKIKAAFKKAEAQRDAMVKHASNAVKKAAKDAQKEIRHFAHIQKDVAVKSFLFFVRTGGGPMLLARRLKMFYKNHPDELKNWWKQFGPWEHLRDAINKGSSHSAAISGDDAGGGSGGGDQAKQYEEGAKQSVGLIQQILALFKKHKEPADPADQKTVDAMQDSIMKDPEIPKVDSSGNVQTPETFGVSAPAATVDTTTNVAAGEGKDKQKPMDDKKPPADPAEDEPFYTKPVFLIGAAAAGMYLLSKD